VIRRLRQTARWVPARIGVNVDATTLNPVTVDSQQLTVDIVRKCADDGPQPQKHPVNDDGRFLMSNVALQMRGPVHGTKDVRKVAVGSSVGAVIETYDFIGFGTAAALYFGTVFFPDSDPLVGTLASFATLGVGFAARPLGGIIGGHLGDRIGRKPVLVASLIIMGLATFAIGLLPTYAMVGVLAPTLLVIVRIIQGLAFGAEWGGAILMTYEHAPWKHKGFFTGLVQAGFPVGLLLANLVFLTSGALPGDWAWRVPFLASLILVIVGLVIRSKVPESPVFEDVKTAGIILKAPIVTVIKDDWRNIVRGIGLRIAETAGYAVAITYMISYINTSELASRQVTLTALCIAAGIGIFATPAWAALTDRIGRKPLYIVSTIFAMLFGIPMFLLVNTGMTILVIITFIISYAVCQNSLAGVQGTWFPELFQAQTRSSGASLSYQISAMVSGFTPFVTTLLFIPFGWLGPALLFSLYAAIGLIAALLTKETWGPVERKIANDAADETPNTVKV
jgi:MHS family shikimate/dehydroshikimate transporter-like MFS transporter